ncbi:MAG: DUF3046 domain-containing protein [Ornithinimicrobium sp.]|uniref:DUF3046 domain-containing protein n=1 Tax=Ornithinimicrobium sp. TaxID=1977084 RepID=UPI0026E113F6|nr:DUF3046 domain-containing protein [Ornithinimicrobium sp.]MDO5739377.1 DUF3046 domain-containing protein [Ornithinimicrobium sp.]
MRLSEFWALMETEFGPGYAAIIAGSHTLGSLGGRTAEEAIEEGEQVRRVWEAVVADLQVPPEHQFLVEPKKRR